MSENEINAVGQNANEPPVPISKAILFTVLSILWGFPSIGAGWVIGTDPWKWFAAKSVGVALSSVRFEQWVALLILGLHLLFIVLALCFRSRERRNI